MSSGFEQIKQGLKAKNGIAKLLFFPRIPVLMLIIIYQKTLSPDHSHVRGLFPHGYCRFNPTCSDYGFAAIAKYGLLKGVILAAMRVIRCNPWNEGGHDPLK